MSFYKKFLAISLLVGSIYSYMDGAAGPIDKSRVESAMSSPDLKSELEELHVLLEDAQERVPSKLESDPHFFLKIAKMYPFIKKEEFNSDLMRDLGSYFAFSQLVVESCSEFEDQKCLRFICSLIDLGIKHYHDEKNMALADELEIKDRKEHMNNALIHMNLALGILANIMPEIDDVDIEFCRFIQEPFNVIKNSNEFNDRFIETCRAKVAARLEAGRNVREKELAIELLVDSFAQDCDVLNSANKSLIDYIDGKIKFIMEQARAHGHQ